MFTESYSHVRIMTKRLMPQDDNSAGVSDRQELLANFNQAELEHATGILIGAGGIGSEVGEGLARKGIGHLKIFDHDSVDLTNLNRQLFFKKDLREPKAVRLAINLVPHAVCGSTLEGFGLCFQDAVVLSLDLRASVVICGVDNAEARVAVSKYYRDRKTPVIFTAVDLAAEHGYVFVQEPGKACFGCVFPKSLHGQKKPCRVPAVKDILKVVGGLTLYAVDSLLMERKRNWNYRNVHLAGFAPSGEMTVEKRTDCPLCGSSI